jgi:hypothetical protein
MSANGQEPVEPVESESSAPSETGGSEQQEQHAPETGQFDRIFERMDQMAATQADLVQRFSQLAEPPEEEGPAPEHYDEQGELTEEGARAVIADLVRQQVAEQMAPREHASMISQRDEAYEALKEEHPDLQDEKIAQAVLGKAVSWANAVDPNIVDRPEFVDVIEAFYKAGQYETLREQQETEQPRPVVLGSAHGASRAQAQRKEIDWQQRVIDAAKADQPRI